MLPNPPLDKLQTLRLHGMIKALSAHRFLFKLNISGIELTSCLRTIMPSNLLVPRFLANHTYLSQKTFQHVGEISSATLFPAW